MTEQEAQWTDWKAQALAALESDDTEDQAAALLAVQTSSGSVAPCIAKWALVLLITLIFMFFFGIYSIGAGLCAYWLVFGR